VVIKPTATCSPGRANKSSLYC